MARLKEDLQLTGGQMLVLLAHYIYIPVLHQSDYTFIYTFFRGTLFYISQHVKGAEYSQIPPG